MMVELCNGMKIRKYYLWFETSFGGILDISVNHLVEPAARLQRGRMEYEI